MTSRLESALSRLSQERSQRLQSLAEKAEMARKAHEDRARRAHDWNAFMTAVRSVVSAMNETSMKSGFVLQLDVHSSAIRREFDRLSVALAILEQDCRASPLMIAVGKDEKVSFSLPNPVTQPCILASLDVAGFTADMIELALTKYIEQVPADQLFSKLALRD